MEKTPKPWDIVWSRIGGAWVLGGIAVALLMRSNGLIEESADFLKVMSITGVFMIWPLIISFIYLAYKGFKVENTSTGFWNTMAIFSAVMIWFGATRPGFWA